MSVEVDGVVYLSAGDVLRELGISRQTLWRWRQEGKVPSGNRFRDGRLLFAEDEVHQIREFAHRVEPAEVRDSSQLRLFNGSRADAEPRSSGGNERG